VLKLWASLSYGGVSVVTGTPPYALVAEVVDPHRYGMKEWKRERERERESKRERESERQESNFSVVIQRDRRLLFSLPLPVLMTGSGFQWRELQPVQDTPSRVKAVLPRCENSRQKREMTFLLARGAGTTFSFSFHEGNSPFFPPFSTSFEYEKTTQWPHRCAGLLPARGCGRDHGSGRL
jgi:hypothetical protein